MQAVFLEEIIADKYFYTIKDLSVLVVGVIVGVGVYHK